MLNSSGPPFDVTDFPSNVRQRVVCIIPTYRAATTVVPVVAEALAYVDSVIVVDDACPENSGRIVTDSYAGDSRVHVVFRSQNGGVGAATKDGIALALEQGADVIVKLDADGQMDASYIANIRRIFEDDPDTVCVKGNRFFDESVLRAMPKVRLFGNAALSLFAKLASGYWNAIDPTNGYLAFNAGLLRVLPWRSFANSYFFEMSVLAELGLKRLPIVELEMPTIYTDAPSSLSVRRVVWEFPPKLFRLIGRRVLVQYFLFDFNLGSIYLMVGSLLSAFAICFASYEWAESVVTHIPRSTGTVMLAVLPFLMGFQLLLNALMYDVQFSHKTHHEIKVALHRRFSLNRTKVRL